MLKNYFTIAWRNLLKNKTFSLINIAGLAIGLSCFLLIALYVLDELSYDRYNEKADRIYRVNSDIRFGGTDLKLAVCSDPMGATLKKDYPQVEQFAKIYASSGSKLLKKGNQFINEPDVAHADSTLFSVFTLPFIAGDPNTALNEPNTVVISENASRKYFGSVDAVGKMIETNDNDRTLYKVTGVMKNIPRNSHFYLDFIFSMDNVDYRFGNYLSHNFQTYILLKNGTDPKVFERNFATVIQNYILPQAKDLMKIKSLEEFEKSGNKLAYSLMPVTKIHLYSDRFPELGVNGNVQYVYIFSAIAIFILLIACINFMNLSTARSASRAKEVGIRKVMGTERRTLIQQFLIESTLTVIISLVIAVLIAWLILPYFNTLSGKSIAISEIFSSKLVPFIVLLPFAVGAIAGSYPAFFLSSFQPIAVLKGRINAGFKKSKLRSALVVFQFATSIFLIIGTIVVFRQLNYIQNKKLGFNKEQVLIIDGTGALGNNNEAFRNEVRKLPGVTGAANAGYLPVSSSSRSGNSFFREAVLDAKEGMNMQVWSIDYDYISTMGMDIIKGRDFSREFGTDSNALIINETTAALLGHDNPIGKKLYTPDFPDQEKVLQYEIIGVVRNFHFESLRQNIGPLCLRLGNSNWSTAFKISTTDIPGLLKHIENKWKSMSPAMPFSYRFLDEAFTNMYRDEQRVGKLALTFSILAILIACLGLFGLATYMAEQRIKEIGVRKVLGASVNHIVTMLSKDFLKLVAIAAIIAFPVAWLFMNGWLQDFAYRISISWWIFLIAALVALLIAVLTVSFQSIKAALMNPVNSLRME